MIHSQCGNARLPGWEQNIPRLGIIVRYSCLCLTSVTVTITVGADIKSYGMEYSYLQGAALTLAGETIKGSRERNGSSSSYAYTQTVMRLYTNCRVPIPVLNRISRHKPFNWSALSLYNDGKSHQIFGCLKDSLYICSR